MNVVEVVKALLKAGDRFLFRDVVFAAGGGLVILSLLYLFGGVPKQDPGTVGYTIAVVISYGLGYAIQDVLTIMRVVRTKAGVPPWSYPKLLYKLFERREVQYKHLSKEEYRTAYSAAKNRLYSEEGSDRDRQDHERIEALKQVGTGLGPCLVIAGLCVFLKSLCADEMPLPGSIGIFGMLLGLALWSLGWLKVTQQAQYLLLKYSPKDVAKNGESSSKDKV